MSKVVKTTMIVCFETDPRNEVVRKLLDTLGFEAGPDRRFRWHQPGMLSVQTNGSVDEATLDRVRALPGVLRTVAIPGDRRLFSPQGRFPESAVSLRNGTLLEPGGLTVIAGPCSVESEAQICEIAQIAKEAGAKALRGGVFKPRTSPYAFGGLREQGLEYLARAREKTGLAVVTEALDTADIDPVAKYADAIQIGSRNMHNFPLLFKAGSHPSGKPVLLKRGFAATIEEFLMAAEYVLLGRLFAGIEKPGLILCERGIRTFDTELRFTLDVGAIPVLKERTHLPVIADPSHPAGHRRFVPPLAKASVAAGADGLLVELHTDPDSAWSDGEQCLDPPMYRELMDDLRAMESAASRRRKGAR